MEKDIVRHYSDAAMSESNVADELIEYIASGQTQKARDLLSDVPNNGLDEQGNTLYHEAVTRQDTKLLKYVIAVLISFNKRWRNCT